MRANNFLPTTSKWINYKHWSEWFIQFFPTELKSYKMYSARVLGSNASLDHTLLEAMQIIIINFGGMKWSPCVGLSFAIILAYGLIVMEYVSHTWRNAIKPERFPALELMKLAKLMSFRFRFGTI